MGLNQGAMGNTEVQMDYLGWAYSLAPQNPKYGYNYILTLYQNNKETEAKEVLVESLKLDPNNVKYLELKNILIVVNKFFRMSFYRHWVE